MSIAEEIRAEIGRQKFTLTRLSRLTKIHPSTLSRKLHKESRPLTTIEIEKIASVLNIPALELVRRAEETDKQERRKI